MFFEKLVSAREAYQPEAANNLIQSDFFKFLATNYLILKLKSLITSSENLHQLIDDSVLDNGLSIALCAKHNHQSRRRRSQPLSIVGRELAADPRKISVRFRS